jgi:broad specificity phosphatase PhoE
LKTLLFLRHGKTAYTGQFPDLTDEGKRQIDQAADEIAQIVGDKKDIRIISSPMPRALGTADIIAKRLGYKNGEITEQELAIRCMDFYDNDKANAIWKQFPTARDVDIAYEKDSRFEAGDVIEKRSAIQHRFFSYLGDLFERFAANKLPDVMIHTSHYEVLWYLATTIVGNREPLRHGEVIMINLEKIDPVNKQVKVFMGFRGIACGGATPIWLKLPPELFRKQF